MMLNSPRSINMSPLTGVKPANCSRTSDVEIKYPWEIAPFVQVLIKNQEVIRLQHREKLNQGTTNCSRAEV